MSFMKKRPNMQVTGAKIAQLRREQGLSIYSFAKALEQPVWLVTLVETAHTEHSQRLIGLLPDAAIETLLREIHEVYGVSYKWLTTRFQDPKHPPLPADAQPQEPLLLPVVLSPDGAMDMLDDVLKLVLADQRSALERYSCFRQSINAISLLLQLQQADLKLRGQDELARQRHQQLVQRLHRRIREWEDELHLTDANE